MKYYCCNPTARSILNPLVERRALTGERAAEVGFFARADIKAGTIIMTADALTLIDLDDRDDLTGMRDWAEFLAHKLPLAILQDLYPRTLEQARTLPVLGQSAQSTKLIDELTQRLSTLPIAERESFLQESLLLHKLVANAFAYKEHYMCLFHTASVFNHSPQANVGTTSNGKRMVFQAKRAIAAGEELTINYGNHLYD